MPSSVCGLAGGGRHERGERCSSNLFVRLKGFLGYLFAPALTLAVLLVSMGVVGVVPFGDKPMLQADAAIQYVGFFGWLHNVLLGNADLFYSFGKALGGGTIALYSYYLASPLNLLVIFFDIGSMPLFFSLIICIKLTLASLFCYVYLVGRFGLRGLWGVLLASAYALSGYGLTAGSNVMWLDAVYMLPLVCLSLFRVLQGKNPVWFALAIFYTVLSNWYAGYMVCLFCALYFLAECFVLGLGFKQFLVRGITICAFLLLGIGMSMPVFFPEIYELLFEGDVSSTSMMASLTKADFLPQNVLAIVGGFLRDFSYGSKTLDASIFPTPYLLIGFAVAMLFLPTPPRQKAAYSILLAMVYVAMPIKVLDMVWTGFMRASSYNPRYAFIGVFCLVICSALSLIALREKQSGKSKLIPFVLAVGVLIAVGVIVPKGNCFAFVRVIVPLVVVFSVLYWSAVALYRGSFGEWGIRCVKFFCVIVFAFDATYLQVDLMHLQFDHRSSSSFSQYVESMQTVIPEYGEAGSLNRVALMGDINSVSAIQGVRRYAPESLNMALGFSGLSHYSSTGEAAMGVLLGNLGYTQLPGRKGITSYNQPNYLIDSIFGIRLIVSESAPIGYDKVGEISLPSPYETSVGVYRNPRALSVGFVAPGALSNFDWTSNLFDNQLLWVNQMVGFDEDFYIANSVKEEGATEKEVQFVVTAAADGPAYFYLRGRGGFDVYVNDEFLQPTGTLFTTNIMPAGTYKKGERFTVTVSGDAMADRNIDIVSQTLDVALANEVLGVLREQQFSLTSFSDRLIEGSIMCEADTSVLFTIPYRAEWEVMVDGKAASVENWMGLMALPVAKGEHVITFSYPIPRSFATGCILGGVSCCAVLAYAFARRAKRKGVCSRDLAI